MSYSDELHNGVENILSKQLFFILGQGKSGTTWLENILNSHTEINCRGEGHFGDVLVPKLLESLKQYDRYIANNNSVFKELDGYPRLQKEQLYFLLRMTIGCLLHRQSQGETPTVVGERTPANSEHMHLFHELFPNVRFIHVIRDVRDIVVSFWFHGLRTNPDWIRKEYGSLFNVAKIMAPAWVGGITTSRKYQAQHPDQYIEVRYEDLHKEPINTICGILQFLGVNATPAVAEHCRANASFERLSGGREVGQENRDSHFRKGSVGDWSNHLDESTIDVIQTHAGKLLRELGYT